MNNKGTKILLIILAVIFTMLVCSGIMNLCQRDEITQQDKQTTVISEEKAELEEKLGISEAALERKQKEKELEFFRNYVKENFKGVGIWIEYRTNKPNLVVFKKPDPDAGKFPVYILSFEAYQLKEYWKHAIYLNNKNQADNDKPCEWHETALYNNNSHFYTKEFTLLESLADYLSAMKNGQKFRKEE